MKIAVVGYGKMGQLVKRSIDSTDGMECAGIVSLDQRTDLKDLESDFDVVIDFSHPDNLKMIGAYAEKKPVALVIATTGFTQEQTKYIEALAEKMPIVFTANYSLGVTIFKQVLKQIAPVLRDTFDIEVIEKHHKLKLDAPSGTAKMLLDAVNEDGKFEVVNGRKGNRKRGAEIGVHAVRGGTIVGEHTVMFAGEDEIFEITHQAHSKQIFVNGAIRAAQFVINQQPGLYNMEDVLFG